MISALTGTLRSVEEDRVHLQSGPILYELLVPAADGPELRGSVGEELTFHTIFYLEGDAARGNLEPKLIGFVRAADRRFFEKFTTVKGIGVRTALRALTEPVGLIAQAIESRDARALQRLKGIGRRTAELIIAELAGKVADFALEYGEKHVHIPAARSRQAYEEDALAALVELGEPRALAERLLERARLAHPALNSTAPLLREMLMLRNVRG
jgi:holliday junction DNA helicase RuvA